MSINCLFRVVLASLVVFTLGACSDDSAPSPGASDAEGDAGDALLDVFDADCPEGVCDDASDDAGDDTYDAASGWCGDGVTNGDERCDDGDLNGSYGACAADCSGPGPRCGDGVVQDVEACDDGEQNGDYAACAADCSGPGPACGDGVLQAGDEVCDHGAINGDYGRCAEDCSGLGEHCGDGELQGDYEACDDGELNGTAGACRDDCSGHTLSWASVPDPDDAALLDGVRCDPHNWLGKYMRYRRRFRGDGTARFPGFISIGEAAGESIPASRREPHVECNNYWDFESCPYEDDPNARGFYNWGDATIWLGAYIAVLATEWVMFSDLGLDTSETETDLYLALMALNRVDEGAEAFYGVPPARDGYFLRDDVPRDFMTLDDGSYRFLRDDDGLEGYECARGNHTCRPPVTDGGDFTSQDQDIGLIHGLALVARLVPEGTTVEGLELPDAAREMVHRLVWHLRDNGWRVTAPDGEHPSDTWGGERHRLFESVRQERQRHLWRRVRRR